MSEVDQSVAELLMIYYKLVAHFRGCSNTAMGVLKTRQPTAPNLVCMDIARSSLHIMFKDSEDILLDFQTTAAQTRALLRDKAKNRTF